VSTVEAVIFVGLQASGKSSFYRERFFRTHVRISLDLLKTRHREKRLIDLCVETSMKFVIDNTNPAVVDREPYIAAAKVAGFRVVCYFFESKFELCAERNATRQPSEQVPTVGIKGTRSRLQIPTRAEGFDEMWFVRLADPSVFLVEEWRDEV
jgi:predicted kinase